MNMEMETYWPEHRVYLFGVLAFLHDALENRSLPSTKLRHYFPHKNIEEFEKSLLDYDAKGYYKVEFIEKAGEQKRYILTHVDKIRFHNELAEYLYAFKLDADKLNLLWNVAKSQLKEQSFEPVVRWRDIYDKSDANKCTLPFFEFIFILVIREWIQLKSVDYTEVVPVLVEAGIVEKMPESIRRRHERPIVKFAIINANVQRKISKARSAIRYKVGIVITPSGKFQVSLDGKRHTLWKYRGKKDSTYRSAMALYDAKEPITKKGLNLKPNSKTPLKGIVNNLHITGILSELFIEYGYDQNKCQTVFMKHKTDADSEQYERLVDCVNMQLTKK